MSEEEPNSYRSQSEPTQWERQMLQQMLNATLIENRRSRRWGIFFKMLGFGYLFLLLGMLLWSDKLDMSEVRAKEHTALVKVEGLIAPETKASADKIVTGLRDAFEDKKTKGVILRLNTPGGSSVQSRYINRELVRLREKYPDIPVYAVCVDICASGGYYIASAADKIYADEGSIVGSIGVLINGFGFVDSMQKLGVERRLLTAGDHKGMLDPFSPLKAGDEEHVREMLAQVHQQFIDAVKEGRGDRLKADEHPELFSGLFWSGEEARDLGLVDEFGSSSYVAREVIGVEEIVDFTPKEEIWDRFARRFGAGAAEVLGSWSGLDSRLQIR
ncbi:MAG: S49 family peptidase [Candidatus Thiodiazotropha sp.]